MGTYFISFRTYGTWFHGDERGSVDDRETRFGAPSVLPNHRLEAYERSLLKQQPVVLSGAMRTSVTDAIREVCAHRGWQLHEVNVRTNHVHAVVTAERTPEWVMNDFKAYGTRRLRRDGLTGVDAEVWAEHGSTRYLNDKESFEAACVYVREMQ